jgi:PadR family transcriptional regulator PadR
MATCLRRAAVATLQLRSGESEEQIRSDWKHMGEKTDVWQGTLALMVLKTIEAMGPLHGYGIARRIEQTSGDLLSVNYGTLYPALLKLEQEGYISSEWGVSENNRKAKYYSLTRAGRKHVHRETRDWEQMTNIVARFLAPDQKS